MKLHQLNYPLYRYCSTLTDIEKVAIFYLYSGIFHHYPSSPKLLKEKKRIYPQPFLSLTRVRRKHSKGEIDGKAYSLHT